MVLVSPKTVRDRVEHARTNTVPLGVRGDLGLEPPNYFENWAFADVDDDGDPEGFEVVMPEEYDGYVHYLSELAKGADTLANQNNSPVSVDRPSYVASQPWVPGAPPRGADAYPVEPPDQPVLQLIPASSAGFAQGAYPLAWNLIDEGGRHTPLSPVSYANVPGNGLQILQGLPQQDTQGARWIGLWEGPKGGDVSSLRMQRAIDVSGGVPKSYALSGFYRFGRRPPTGNETFLVQPPQLQAGRDFWLERDAHYGMPVCRIQLAVSYETEHGETLASVWSAPIIVRRALANTRVAVIPPTQPLGVRRWYLYVLRSWNPDGGPYEVLRYRNVSAGYGAPGIPMPIPNSRVPRSYLRNPDLRFPQVWSKAYVYGTDTQSSSNAGQGPPAPASEHTLETSNLPTEDKSGMPGPATPLEDPTYPGVATLAPGPYWHALAGSVRGEIGPACTPQRINVPAGQMLRVLPAHPNNYFPNAEGIEVDGNGAPLDHTLTKNQGDITLADGVITCTTLGALTPSSTVNSPVHKLQSRPVERERVFTLREDVAVQWTQGNFVVYVEQLDATKAVVARHEVKRIGAGGVTRVERTIRQAQGQETAGALLPDGTITFHPSTVYVRLSHEIESTTTNGVRNMVAKVSKPRLGPKEGQPRRRIEAPAGSRSPSNPNATPETPVPKVSAKGVEPAPSPPAFEAVRVLDRLTFEDGLLPGAPWVLTRSPADASVVAAVGPAYAITGTQGLRLSRNTSVSAVDNLQRAYGTAPGQRSTLALRERIRANQCDTFVDFLAIKRFAGGLKHTGDLACVRRDAAGNLYLLGIHTARVPADGSLPSSAYSSAPIASTNLGDVADVEIIASRASNGKGKVDAYVGINGTPRTFAGTVSNLDWPASAGAYPQRVVFGPYWQYDASKNWSVDIDEVVVTDTGDALVEGGQLPLEPIAKPDRPTVPGVVIDTLDSEGGVLNPGWTPSRTPADATTVLQVQAASAIDGTFGLRVSDSGTAQAASLYVERIFPTGARDTTGFAPKYRVVALPSTGEVELEGLYAAGQRVASVFLNSLGELYARAYNAGGQLLSKRIWQGLAAGSVFSVELIAYGAGTASGALSAWVTVAGQERQLMAQEGPFDWTGLATDRVRVGIVSESGASTTSSLDVDTAIITQAGTVVYSEYASDGTPINQVHAFYSRNLDPVGSGRFLQTKEPVAVEPNTVYTAAIRSRVTVPPVQETPALPYSFYAVDDKGQRHDLADLYGGGVLGEHPWEDPTQPLTIPPNCYELWMESRQIGGGEFVCQDPALKKGLVPAGQPVPREGAYPLSGWTRVVLDTATPDAGFRVGRKWLRVGAQVDTPDGTAASVTYQSSNSPLGPWSPPVTDPALVPQARYLAVDVNGTSDGSDTWVLRSGSPFVESVLMATPALPLSTLLRADGSEFRGGVALNRYSFPRALSEFDVRMGRNGRVSRFKVNEPVGELTDFEVYACTEEAMDEIQRTWLESDFRLEGRGRRMRIRPTERLKWEEKTHTAVRDETGVVPIRRMWGMAKVARVEVYEVSEIDGVYP